MVTQHADRIRGAMNVVKLLVGHGLLDLNVQNQELQCLSLPRPRPRRR
jgi:hypothetical protein